MQDVAVGNSPISLSAVCPLPRFEIDDAKPHKVIALRQAQIKLRLLFCVDVVGFLKSVV